MMGRDGLTERARGGNRRALVDSVMTAKMVEIIESHPSFTLRQINRSLQTSLPQKPVISVTTIARSLTAQLISTKKLHDIPQERNTEPTKLMRNEYVEWLVQIQPVYELIFIDETDINLWCKLCLLYTSDAADE